MSKSKPVTFDKMKIFLESTGRNIVGHTRSYVYIKPEYFEAGYIVTPLSYRGTFCVLLEKQAFGFRDFYKDRVNGVLPEDLIGKDIDQPTYKLVWARRDDEIEDKTGERVVFTRLHRTCVMLTNYRTHHDLQSNAKVHLSQLIPPKLQ